MKKLLLILSVFFVCLSVFAGSLTATVDLGTVQDLFIKTNSYQFSTDIRYLVKDKYELRIPLTFSLSQENQFLDAGLFLNYYPFQNRGLFFGLSLVQFGYVTGQVNLEKKLYSLNEISLGWTFKIGKGLIVEPSLSIRDPSGTYADEYDLIKGYFPCNRTFRIKLSTGWRFDFNNQEEN